MPESEYDNLEWIDGDNPEQKRYPKPIPHTPLPLYDEIKLRCDRKYFMEPYDEKRIIAASDILVELSKIKNKNEIVRLKELRNRAMDTLGIKFSTEEIFDRLKFSCDPSKVDPRFTREVTTYYKEILENADNAKELDRIEQSVRKVGIPIISPQKPKDDELINILVFLFISLVLIAGIILLQKMII